MMDVDEKDSKHFEEVVEEVAKVEGMDLEEEEYDTEPEDED